MNVQRTALVTGANKGIGLELLDDAGPTGRFFDARGPVPW